MRDLLRGKQDVWFCEITEKVVGIDTVKIYSKPIHKKMSVSATSGVVNYWGAGSNIAYDRYITSYERDFHPKEGMGVFVDVMPILNEEGELITVSNSIDGNIDICDGGILADYSTGDIVNGNEDDETYEYKTTPDYILNRILDTQRGTVARYGIKKV